MPEISVVIPTYNRSAMLARAVESVRAQDFRDFEVIVVDDASTDNTEHLLRTQFGEDMEKGFLRYIRAAQNQGRSASRNDGIGQATAGLIAFLDDDDEWLPDHLANLYDFMRLYRDIGIVFSNWDTITEQTHETRPGTTNIRTGAGSAYARLMLRALIGFPSTCMVRASLVRGLGGFNVNLPPREDWELFSKCALVGGTGFVDNPTVHIYVHPGSYSKNKVQWVNATESAWNSILSFARDNGVGPGNRIVAERALRLSRAFITIGNFDKSRMYLKAAISHNPISVFSSITLENTFKLIIGKDLYNKYRKWKE